MVTTRQSSGGQVVSLSVLALPRFGYTLDHMLWVSVRDPRCIVGRLPIMHQLAQDEVAISRSFDRVFVLAKTYLPMLFICVVLILSCSRAITYCRVDV